MRQLYWKSWVQSDYMHSHWIPQKMGHITSSFQFQCCTTLVPTQPNVIAELSMSHNLINMQKQISLWKKHSGAKIYWQLQYVHRYATGVRIWVKHEYQQSVMLWSAKNQCMWNQTAELTCSWKRNKGQHLGKMQHNFALDTMATATLRYRKVCCLLPGG